MPMGLTAADILGRTRGSIAWGLFYGLFVLAASMHGAIGLRTVASEWLSLKGRALDGVLWGAGLTLAVLGLRAVFAVVLA
jgi:fumarate reductase subunit C